jgi:hypothetical protein
VGQRANILVADNMRMYRVLSDIHAEEAEKCEHRECLSRSRGLFHKGRILLYASKWEYSSKGYGYVRDMHYQVNVLSDNRRRTKNVVIQVTE